MKSKNIKKVLNMNEENVCVICGTPLNGYGNNADPVADGRCCDDCNVAFVIPARMRILFGLED